MLKGRNNDLKMVADGRGASQPAPLSAPRLSIWGCDWRCLRCLSACSEAYNARVGAHDRRGDVLPCRHENHYLRLSLRKILQVFGCELCGHRKGLGAAQVDFGNVVREALPHTKKRQVAPTLSSTKTLRCAGCSSMPYVISELPQKQRSFSAC